LREICLPNGGDNNTITDWYRVGGQGPKPSISETDIHAITGPKRTAPRGFGQLYGSACLGVAIAWVYKSFLSIGQMLSMAASTLSTIRPPTVACQLRFIFGRHSGRVACLEVLLHTDMDIYGHVSHIVDPGTVLCACRRASWKISKPQCHGRVKMRRLIGSPGSGNRQPKRSRACSIDRSFCRYSIEASWSQKCLSCRSQRIVRNRVPMRDKQWFG